MNQLVGRPRRTSRSRDVAGAVGLLLLMAASLPPVVAGQWGDLRLEVGGSRAFSAPDANLDASTYVTAGLQIDRWALSGGRVYAGVFGGLATDSVGDDWLSAVVGGKTVTGVGGPVIFSLSGSAYGFRVAAPFLYRAFTVSTRPEIRIPMGRRAALVLYGEGGAGSSTIEFRRGDHVRSLEQELWHYGGGPELEVRFGRAIASASVGILETARGTYQRGELQVRTAGANGSFVDASLRLWDTPSGTETTGSVSLTIPFGNTGWFAQVRGGRTDPDPLVQAEPGAQGGISIGRRLVRFRAAPADPTVTLEATSGGARALFRIEATQAQDVEVLGDFSAWEPQAMTRDAEAWVLELPLPSGTYHFGFLVDGDWFVPDTAPGQITDDWGQMNATIVVP